MNVRGKTIGVTGGAGGLGSVVAKMLAKGGAKVFIMDLDKASGEAAAQKMIQSGGDVRFYAMDVTSETAWPPVMRDVVGWTGSIDALVNNTGINIRKPIEDMVLDEWMTMMKVNTGSVFLGCKNVIPIMRVQGGGAIVNISSVCGLIGHKYTPEAYTAAKGAVTQLTKAIASRYGSEGIRCNSVHPSTMDTPMAQQMFQSPVRKSERYAEVPLGRLAKAEDVASAVYYLVSDEGAFLNGVALPVDGGLTCY